MDHVSTNQPECKQCAATTNHDEAAHKADKAKCTQRQTQSPSDLLSPCTARIYKTKTHAEY